MADGDVQYDVANVCACASDVDALKYRGAQFGDVGLTPGESPRFFKKAAEDVADVVVLQGTEGSRWARAGVVSEGVESLQAGLVFLGGVLASAVERGVGKAEAEERRCLEVPVAETDRLPI